jgi:hypothetical protein
MADRIVKIEGPVTIKGADGINVNFQPAKAAAVTIASETIYPRGLLYIGVGGDVAVIPADNADAKNADPTSYVVFKGMSAGTFLPVYVIRVGDAGNGTTATDIVICY